MNSGGQQPEEVKAEVGKMTRVMGREGEDDGTVNQIYLAVVQLVMMYGSET